MQLGLRRQGDAGGDTGTGTGRGQGTFALKPPQQSLDGQTGVETTGGKAGSVGDGGDGAMQCSVASVGSLQCTDQWKRHTQRWPGTDPMQRTAGSARHGGSGGGEGDRGGSCGGCGGGDGSSRIEKRWQRGLHGKDSHPSIATGGAPPVPNHQLRMLSRAVVPPASMPNAIMRSPEGPLSTACA